MQEWGGTKVGVGNRMGMHGWLEITNDDRRAGSYVDMDMRNNCRGGGKAMEGCLRVLGGQGWVNQKDGRGKMEEVGYSRGGTTSRVEECQ